MGSRRQEEIKPDAAKVKFNVTKYLKSLKFCPAMIP